MWLLRRAVGGVLVNAAAKAALDRSRDHTGGSWRALALALQTKRGESRDPTRRLQSSERISPCSSCHDLGEWTARQGSVTQPHSLLVRQRHPYPSARGWHGDPSLCSSVGSGT